MGVNERIEDQIVLRTEVNPPASRFNILDEYNSVRFSPWTVPVGGFVFNTDCWAAGLDFSGVGAWRGELGGYWWGSALISPRHVLFAGHTNPDTDMLDDTVRFIQADGSVHEAICEPGGHNVLGPFPEDLYIRKLTADVPSTVSHYSVLPLDYGDYLTYGVGGGGESSCNVGIPPFPDISAKPLIYLDQEREVFIRFANFFSPFTRVWGVSYGVGCDVQVYPERNDYFKFLVAGDSSAPQFILVDGELVLLSVHSSSGSGMFVSEAGNYAGLNAAMTALGGGFQLTDYDFVQESSSSVTSSSQTSSSSVTSSSSSSSATSSSSSSSSSSSATSSTEVDSRSDISQTDVMTAIVALLRSELDLNERQCFLAIEAGQPTIPTGGDYWLTVAPGDGIFVDGEQAEDNCTEETTVTVTAYARMMRDSTDRDTKTLQDATQGLLVLKGKVLEVLVGADPISNQGTFVRDVIFAKRPERSGVGQNGIAAWMSIDFGVNFDWSFS